jgi:hypothetical protein
VAPAAASANVGQVSSAPSGEAAPTVAGRSSAPAPPRPIATTGSKERRTTTFTFVLQRPSRVVVTVKQLSPACVGVGHFAVTAHAGLNRLRFAGAVHGRRLTPGTYRISFRTASGRVLRRVILVVVGGDVPARAELRALRAANVCGGATSASPATFGGDTSVPLGPQRLPQPGAAAAGLAPTHGPNLHSGVLASSVEKTARAIQPLLVGLLALSILLLGAASLPREAVPGPRVHEALARHRLELAALGAGVLVAVALTLLLS